MDENDRARVKWEEECRKSELKHELASGLAEVSAPVHRNFKLGLPDFVVSLALLRASFRYLQSGWTHLLSVDPVWRGPASCRLRPCISTRLILIYCARMVVDVIGPSRTGKRQLQHTNTVLS